MVTEPSTTRSPAARHTAVVVLVVVALRSGRLPALLLALGAPVSELVQHYVLSHRSGDPLDVAADRTGVALGAAVAWWWASRREWSAAARSS